MASSPSRRTLPRRTAHRGLALLAGTAVAAAGVVGLPGSPTASAGPCSEMFGNFGSLRESATGAGMGPGSASGSASGSTGSTGSGGRGSSDSLLSRDGSLVQQLETGSLGNGISGSLDPVTGSVYGLPQWQNTPETGTVPVLTGPTRFVQLVTGPTSPNETVARHGVHGTDLGIMWENGDPAGSELLTAFGDTMGDCTAPDDQWRSNVLFRSSDRTLSDGMTFSGALTRADGRATSIVPRSGLPGETTIIPTSGIEVGGVQYLRYMSVAKWGTPASWTTNYSGVAYSTDYGRTWTVAPRAARPITTTVPVGAGAPSADAKWARAQMSAYLKGRDGYLYEYLTPSGRSGSAVLARVPMPATAAAPTIDGSPVLDPSAYRYWDGSSWVADIARATSVLPAPVSELSVQWNEHLGKYLSMYSSGLDSVLVRTADRPEGPWSRPTTIVDYGMLPGVYGGFQHPWSSGKDLYFLATTWNAYNVFLVHTDLSQLDLGGFRRVAESATDAPLPSQSTVVRRVPLDQLPGGMVPRS